MKVLVIGAGAAGYFAALSCAEHHPKAKITIIEKSSKVLAKVKISGGGRCNVTNACEDPRKLATHYPRGEKQLSKLFRHFNTVHTRKWFESRGVKLRTYDDGCIFPLSNDSQTIIDCFVNEANRLGIQLMKGTLIEAIIPTASGFRVQLKEKPEVVFDKIIVATGGNPNPKAYDWLASLGHTIEPPLPSLFTFNMPNESIKSLMGVVVENARVRIQGTKLSAEGPLLITHWGMSGPAILKLSAWGARDLAALGYHAKINVNWTGQRTEEEVRKAIIGIAQANPKMKLTNKRPFDLPKRLWEFLLTKIDLQHDKPWGEVGKKGENKLVNVLTNDEYAVEGKTTFKEEFVTCGGVSLSDILLPSMQSKKCPGMYFAGEVLDIDGITGGFNFQAAWTTGYLAGQLM